MPTQTPELIPADVKTPSLETMPRVDTPAIWESFREQLNKLKVTAETVTVTDVSQTAEMKIARTTRLTLKDLRVAVEHKRKELVEAHLRAQQQINGDAKQIKDYCEKLENRLLEQEQFIALENARIEKETLEKRTAELAPFLPAGAGFTGLGTMDASAYNSLLAQTKASHAAGIEAERKAKEQAEAEAKAERERIEAQRVENERLKKEAAEREEAAKKEREAAAALLAKEREEAARAAREAQAKADAEAEKIRKEAAEREEAAKKEREAAAALLAKEREEAARAAREAQAKADAEAEKIRKEAAERERIASEKADKERAAIEAKAKADRDAREKIEAEIAAKKAAEEKAAAERLATEKKAAAAPDKAKLLRLAADVRALELPVIKNQVIAETIADQREKFAVWIIKQVEAL